ncbi:hypothetical protein LRLP16767_LR202_00032 [Limosilactobacillus reuteri]|uniref:Uncharacterized protein n=1 Tax=Limosilactobacillus reuteri TaxID=1598 RepID=A0A0U5JV10_LIMRT|nr:hypothetical protein LRLP16767_LR202_00032 [Limosilactobacillus reuteri]
MDEGLGTKRGTVTRRRLGKQRVGLKKEGGWEKTFVFSQPQLLL